MLNKHSKAPWRVVPESLPKYVLVTNESKIIATVHGTDSAATPPEEIFDNAYIIAKAPQLYKTVKLTREFFQLSETGNTDCGAIARMEKLNDEIQEMIKELRLK